MILYHGRDYWNFPKGGIETGERTFQTALREIREETGIMRNELKFQEYFKVNENFTFWRKNEKVYKTIIFYLAETKRKVVKIADEKTGQPQEGFAWFTYKEALKVLSNHKDIMRVLKQAYDFLQKKGVVRTRLTAVRQGNYAERTRTDAGKNKPGADSFHRSDSEIKRAQGGETEKPRAHTIKIQKENTRNSGNKNYIKHEGQRDIPKKSP